MELLDFPVQVKVAIAWGEMDALGHVNNVNYYKYFENARMQYFQEIGLEDTRTLEGIGTILAQTSCKYIKQLKYPDQIVIGARVKSMSKSSFVMEYVIVSEKIGVVALGEGVLVMYDYDKSEKTQLPLVLRETIKKIEKANPNL